MKSSVADFSPHDWFSNKIRFSMYCIISRYAEDQIVTYLNECNIVNLNYLKGESVDVSNHTGHHYLNSYVIKDVKKN